MRAVGWALTFVKVANMERERAKRLQPLVTGCIIVGAGPLSARRVTGNFPNYGPFLLAGKGTQGWPPTLKTR